MNQIRRTAVTMFTLALGLIGFTAASPAALAYTRPDPQGASTATVGSQIPVVSHGGSGVAGWELALAAVGIALVAACLTVLVERIARGRHATARLA